MGINSVGSSNANEKANIKVGSDITARQEKKKDDAWSALSKVIASNKNTSTDNSDPFIVQPHVTSSTYVKLKDQ